ncbi:MAG: ComF family protein [Patescibacteria group bacterium]|nr:ComF family protein [Patescibacteria group bacterium]
MNILTKTKNILLDILFPPICLNCGFDLKEKEKRDKICEKCMDSIITYSSFFCPKCKSRIPGEEKTCHKDVKYLLAPVTNYKNDSVKNIVKFIKYNRWTSLLNTIEPILEKYLSLLKYNFENFIIIPIPLHKDRERERGFNQSELIAKIICKKTGASININALKRIRFTKTQAELKDPEERMKNVKDCFALIDPNEVKNKNIILVDDVFTTGSTINEAVKNLKQAGAKKIIAFVFAKA